MGPQSIISPKTAPPGSAADHATIGGDQAHAIIQINNSSAIDLGQSGQGSAQGVP